MSKMFTEGYQLGKATAGANYSDSSLTDLLSAYKKRIAGNYRPLRPEEILSLPPGGLLVSRKIDGELWFLVSTEDGIFLINPSGRVVHGALEVIASVKNLPIGTIIAGELFSNAGGPRERVGDLASAMAKESKVATSAISFTGFDIVRHADQAPPATYRDRHALLQELIQSSPQLSVIEAEEMQPASVKSRFDDEVVSGASEGLIVRLPSGLIYKLKPTITIDAVIIAFTAKVDSPELVRSILLGLMHPSGEIQLLGGCGNLGSDQDRKNLFEKISGSKVPSSIRYASDGGGLYSFVKPKIIVEVRVTDLQAEKTDGSLAMSAVAIFSDRGWKGIRTSECPRPIHPVFERVRDDKVVNSTDIRFDQISSYLVMKSCDDQKAVLPSSEVLRREVWTKEAKGQLAVRKLLVWKTNKEKIDSSYPAFVVNWTDYSHSRASPLDREVKIAPDVETAITIADALVEENIKKGWNKVELDFPRN